MEIVVIVQRTDFAFVFIGLNKQYVCRINYTRLMFLAVMALRL